MLASAHVEPFSTLKPFEVTDPVQPPAVRTEFLIPTDPAVVAMPAPVFPLKVVLVSVTVAPAPASPPPLAAELPLTVVLVVVSVPVAARMPPPLPVTVFAVKVVRAIVTVPPACSSPPPDGAALPSNVTSWNVAMPRL